MVKSKILILTNENFLTKLIDGKGKNLEKGNFYFDILKFLNFLI